MVHLFFVGVILSELLFDQFDNLPIIIFGLYGLVRFIFRKGRGISAPEAFFLLFVVYLFTSLPLMDEQYSVALYCVFYLMQFGVFSYIMGEMHRNPIYFSIQMNNIVRWQSAIVVIGLLDLALFMAGYESPIRDHVRSWKVDSFYKSPNILGVISALAVVYLLNWRWLRGRLLGNLLIVLNLLGVLISGSSMAIGVVIISEVVRRIGFWKSAILAVIAVAITFDMLIMNVPEILNRRLEIWAAAFDMWGISPWIGIGSGNFQLLSTINIGGIEVSGYYGLHSLYLWLLIETGIVGTFIFALFLLSLFWHMTESWWWRYLHSLPLVLFVTQLTENYLDHEEVFIVIFWLMTASIIMKRGVRNDEE